ncbi:MAG: hypothetical protein R2865_01855 [Deinococcales bacterium]
MMKKLVAQCIWRGQNSYLDTGSNNHSCIHWDMICDLRQGGEIYLDGELFQRHDPFCQLVFEKPSCVSVDVILNHESARPLKIPYLLTPTIRGIIAFMPCNWCVNWC